MPLTIRTETQEFRDDASLDVETMVDTLRSTKGRSYSACPSVADWERAFGEDDDVLAFTITSGLSGSFRAACAAKLNCEENSPSRRICIIDSLSTGPEIVLLIEKAVSELSAGADFDAVCRSVQDYQRRFGSFQATTPDQYKKVIENTINTVLPVWAQYRATYISL